MVIAKHIAQKPSSRSLTASSSLLGLAAGAVGWSGLAQAAGDETSSQVLLLPEHYELMDNGVVVFKLETGENLSLTADQYLILEDGLLLITDELAQASIHSLPVMGSVRAQLLSELAPVATVDGIVAEATPTPAQTLAITQGKEPRLSEQVDLQRYEIAQAVDGSSSEVGEAVAVGLSVSPGVMALLGMLMTSDQPEAAVDSTAGRFWQSTSNGGTVPEGADVVLEGTDGDDYFGYSAASLSAESPLVDFGKSSTVVVNAGGGSNYLSAGEYTAGGANANFTYNGGDGVDQIKVVDAFGSPSDNSVTLNMGNGANSLIAGTDAAYFGHFRYNGGTGTDSLVFGSGALYGNDSIVDLGDDTAADEITFLGTAGFGLPNHPVVQNFDADDGDMIYLPTGVTADLSEITAYGTDLTWEDYSGHYCLTFADLSSIGSDPTSVADLVASFA